MQYPRTIVPGVAYLDIRQRMLHAAQQGSGKGPERSRRQGHSGSMHPLWHAGHTKDKCFALHPELKGKGRGKGKDGYRPCRVNGIHEEEVPDEAED